MAFVWGKVTSNSVVSRHPKAAIRSWRNVFEELQKHHQEIVTMVFLCVSEQVRMTITPSVPSKDLLEALVIASPNRGSWGAERRAGRPGGRALRQCKREGFDRRYSKMWYMAILCHTWFRYVFCSSESLPPGLLPATSYMRSVSEARAWGAGWRVFGLVFWIFQVCALPFQIVVCFHWENWTCTTTLLRKSCFYFHVWQPICWDLSCFPPSFWDWKDSEMCKHPSGVRRSSPHASSIHPCSGAAWFTCFARPCPKPLN